MRAVRLDQLDPRSRTENPQVHRNVEHPAERTESLVRDRRAAWKREHRSIASHNLIDTYVR
jgi:hypothetical protein